MSKLKTLFLLAGALFFLSGQAVLADVSWSDVKGKIMKAKDYSVDYAYSGPSGVFDFDYRYANKGANIRTEITGSKSDKTRVGTVIVYDKSWNADKIRAKTGGGLIVRKLSHADVQGKPFHQGIFQMILKDVGGAKPSASTAGGTTTFTFPGGYTIKTNSAGDILETRRSEKGKVEKRDFSGHKWNNSPATDFKG